MDRKFGETTVDLGESKAMVNLALCYQYGKGVEENWIEAAKLYRQAADLGDGKAMVNLGLCYQYGKGVQEDWNKAIEKYQLAARVGEISAIATIQDLLLQNFLGQGNYKTRNAGWTKNKYTHSAVAPAFDPPIMTGNWKQLTAKEVTVFDKIITPFEILELNDQLENYIGQYARFLPLRFYKDCHLVDIQLYNPLNNYVLVFSAILNTERILLLNGESNIIHELNRHILALDDKKNTLAYLQFFCSYVLGDHGPFQIITNLNEIPFKESASQHIQNKIKSSLYHPRYIEGSFEREGFKKLEACVLHGNTLFNSVFRVFSDGIIAMENYNTIVDKLPLFRRQYNGIFRTILRPFEN